MCGDPLTQTLNISVDTLPPFPQKVSSFIHNNQWHIPDALQSLFQNLKSIITKVIIPHQSTSDKRIWTHNSKGDLP
jgi:hypothetical protein